MSVQPVQPGPRCLCGHDSFDHLGLGGAGPCDHRACGCLYFRADYRPKEAHRG